MFGLSTYLILNCCSFSVHQIITQLSDSVKTNYIKGRYYVPEGVWQLLHPKHFDNALFIHHLEGRGKTISNVSAMIREGLADGTHQLLSPDNIESESDGVVMSHNIADAFKPFQKRNGTSVTPEIVIISGAPGMGKTMLCKEMAYEWAKGQFLDNNCLVFYVYLQDLKHNKFVIYKLLSTTFIISTRLLQSSRKSVLMFSMKETTKI